MWGRVIEHEMGFRGELAYPVRLRLVCAPCLLVTAVPVPTAVFPGPTGELMTLCASHAPDARPLGVSPEEIQAQLLSTYAVDPLGDEALGEPEGAGRTMPPTMLPTRAGRPGPRRRTPTLATQAGEEARELVRTVTGRVGIVTTIALFFVLRALGVLTSPTVPGPTAVPVATASAPVTPLPGTGDPIRVELTHEDDRDRRFLLEFLCGELHGTVVTRTRCGAGTIELLGAAVFPRGSRADCSLDGYTRKGRYSVCWIDPPGGTEPPPHPEIRQLPGVRFEDVFRTERARTDAASEAQRRRVTRRAPPV
jgi:hypothetical protein